MLHHGHFVPLDEPGVTETLPYGINTVDQIVGTNFILEHGRFEPLSGTPANPAPNIVTPVAINDFGLVLVIAQTVTGEAAFLATPIRRHF